MTRISPWWAGVLTTLLLAAAYFALVVIGDAVAGTVGILVMQVAYLVAMLTVLVRMTR